LPRGTKEKHENLDHKIPCLDRNSKPASPGTQARSFVQLALEVLRLSVFCRTTLGTSRGHFKEKLHGLSPRAPLVGEVSAKMNGWMIPNRELCGGGGATEVAIYLNAARFFRQHA
jgi:hypothetical protein